MALGYSLTMIQDDQIWQYGMQCGDAMAIAYKLFVFSLLKSLFFFCMATMRNAQTKIAIVYMREQSL